MADTQPDANQDLPQHLQDAVTTMVPKLDQFLTTLTEDEFLVLGAALSTRAETADATGFSFRGPPVNYAAYYQALADYNARVQRADRLNALLGYTRPDVSFRRTR